MAPRLRLLALLIPAACAGTADREAAAVRSAFDSGQASLAAFPQPAFTQPAFSMPSQAGPPRGAALVDTHHGRQPATASELLGAAPDALRRVLGEPALRRREGSAEIWLYAGAACALDLVLYPAAGALRVAHAEARANGATPRTEAACLREIAAPSGLQGMPAIGGRAAPGDQGA